MKLNTFEMMTLVLPLIVPMGCGTTDGAEAAEPSPVASNARQS